MTSVLSRTPLEALSMTSTQRPTRRRSARQAFEEEDLAGHGVGKKTKVEGAAARESSAGVATNGVDKQRRKSRRIVYEDADDFQFSRTKPKKSKTQTASIPESIPEEGTQPAPTTGVTATKRRKKDASSPPPEQTKGDEEAAAPRRRRSARLSGEKEQIHRQTEPAPVEHKARRASSRKTLSAFSEIDEDIALVTVKKSKRLSRAAAEKHTPQAKAPAAPAEPQPTPKERVVEKPRSPTKITLPFADTPVIRRNKEMRKGGGKGARRSSTGTRGRRASSLIDSGTSNGLKPLPTSPSAIPHSEVSTEDFYKHIAQDLPEPRRMKQLLVWCGSRALPEKPSGGVKDTSAILAARAIQQELLDDFAQKSELSDWFSREDTEPTAIVKKANPRNERMAEMVKELEEEIKRLQVEERAWKSVHETSQSLPQPPAPAAQSPADPDSALPNGYGLSPDILDDPIQSAILAALTSKPLPDLPTEASASSPAIQPLPSNTSPSSVVAQANALTNRIEPTVDIFADGVQQLSQYRTVAERVADQVLGAAAERLEERDGEAREKAGMANVGVGDVLGALGRVMAERERMGR